VKASDRTPAERILDQLHERAGICGHCGLKKCLGKKSHSILPETLKTSVVLAAIKAATGEEP
jgi:hypothetical protein